MVEQVTAWKTRNGRLYNTKEESLRMNVYDSVGPLRSALITFKYASADTSDLEEYLVAIGSG